MKMQLLETKHYDFAQNLFLFHKVSLYFVQPIDRDFKILRLTAICKSLPYIAYKDVLKKNYVWKSKRKCYWNKMHLNVQPLSINFRDITLLEHLFPELHNIHLSRDTESVSKIYGQRQ
jgi:hypothetical protein